MSGGGSASALALATALALIGCGSKGDAPAPEAEAKQADPKAWEEGDAGVEAPPPEVKPAVDPASFADPAVAYPSALVDLFDLVPADADAFVVVRDPSALLSIFGTYVADQLKGLEPLARLADPSAPAKIDIGVKAYAQVAAELAKGVVNLDKGVVFLPASDAVIYGANDPEALPNLLKSLGAETLPEHCRPLEDAAGYAVCGRDKAAVDAFKPGRAAGERQAAFVAALAGFDPQRGNVVGQVKTDGGTPIRFAIATPPNGVHGVAAFGELAQDAVGFLGTGTPRAIGIGEPGGAFVWAQVDTSALADQIAQAGPPVSTVGKTFTGELYFGGARTGVPLALLAGVTDPYPASGLVGIASTMLDKVPNQLPDGTKVALSIEKIQAGGKTVDALHAVLSDSAQVEQLAELGVGGDAFAFAAGKYAAGGLGASEAFVKAVAEFDAAGPAAEHLKPLPPALARVLAAGEASWAMHLPLDGLQAPSMGKQLGDGMATLPDAARGGLSGEAFANAVLSVIAPMSSLSIWMTHPSDQRVVHVQIAGFVDEGTDKGAAARAAVAKVTAGGDRKAAYGALAAEHDDARFTARSGTSDAAIRSAITGAFVLQLLAQAGSQGVGGLLR